MTWHPPTPTRAPRRRHARGMGLIDALIALALLAFGLLGMTRMQTSLVRQTTESQTRLTAAQLGDELLSTVLVDVGNAGCYTLPDAGDCASVAARERAEDWETRVAGALPGDVEATSALADGQFTVTITWTGKDSGDTRTLEATTDVRE
ncbi:pilus assembly protein PilV [Rubrivivax albus]|uniref:Pilus assembly protein PilV n=1 Tax=Rubrivivax albus TaxID=2499835 RepID=A0A437JVL1_9BURK|nr:pilus assembly protein PilV [Rubrivivax albus]RVT51432.1 pilus assembly protein PilV [Rubrivivax albus]